MKIFEKIQVEQVKIAKVICNMCGKSAMRGEASWGPEFYGHSISYTGGYLSGPEDFNVPAIRDRDKIEFDLCEVCIFNLSKTLKIPARFFDIGDDDEIEKAQDQIDQLYKAPHLDEIAQYLCSDNAEVRMAAELKREELLNESNRNPQT
jgi:hypothetical protein